MKVVFMAKDPELEAMEKILELLSGLNEEQQIRALDWIHGRLNLTQRKSVRPSNTVGDNTNVPDFSQFETVADMFGAITVTTEAEKVLMVASYIQMKEGKKELISREISSILKDLGHRVSNITDTISSLGSKKPQLMMQTRKEGSTRQAQKKYKVTAEGIKEAKRILLGTQSIDTENA